MLTRLDLRGKLPSDRTARASYLRTNLPRPTMAETPPVDAVRSILDQVKADGDKALRELTLRFDKVEVNEFRVPKENITAALDKIPAGLRQALEQAAANIEAFQKFTMPENGRFERDGLVIDEIWSPVDSAGCYVPGGLALYPSSVLMSAVIAKVAGVERVVLCVPPGPNGEVADSVLAAAAIAGVDEVYAVGGAQAIGAMAYGTESIAPVDVIVGPGNVYVATAKTLVSGVAGVPSSFAGPSEVVVIADETTPVECAAIDLIKQAEHGPDGLSWLITWSDQVADQVDQWVGTFLEDAPRRSEVEQTFSDGGYIVIVDDAQAAMDVSNAVAPEHLEIMIADPDPLVAQLRHAGAVFTGFYAPASVGDYAVGPSHVLPVYSSARFGSALGVRDFLREQHVINLDKQALKAVTPIVEELGIAEGLDAHAKSVTVGPRK